MQYIHQPDASTLQSPWSLVYRVALAFVIFAIGFSGFRMGAQVAERAMSDAGVLAHAYYAAGLFVMGGLDLGAPSGGPLVAQVLLWTAYITAPILTVATLIDAFIRAYAEQAQQRIRFDNHIVLAGHGRLGRLYLSVIKELEPNRPVVVVDLEPSREPIVTRTVRFVRGDITSPAVMEQVALDRAAAVVLMTSDDLVNLEAAVAITDRQERLKNRVVVHLADIVLKRLIAEQAEDGTQDDPMATQFFELGAATQPLAHEAILTANRDQILNANRVTARHLVQRDLVPHFIAGNDKSVLVLAGFGGFGQSILEIVQREAYSHIARVVVADPNASMLIRQFRAQVRPGAKSLNLYPTDGSLSDPATWQRVAAVTTSLEQRGRITIVLGTRDDGQNIRLGLWLSRQYPLAFVIVRCFESSALANRLQASDNFQICYESTLLRHSLRQRHRRWFQLPE